LELILQEQKNQFGKPASDKLIDNISFTKAQTNDEWLVKKIIKDLKEIDY
jgi:hypothetical protein